MKRVLAVVWVTACADEGTLASQSKGASPGQRPTTSSPQSPSQGDPSDDSPHTATEDPGPGAMTGPTGPTTTEGPCPADMRLVPAPGGDVCMDVYEAPNKEGEVPFVMFTLPESQAWCEARGKRLCYDDDWTFACEGTEALAYVYGDTYDSSVCNTNKTWRQYSDSKMNGWGAHSSSPERETMAEVYAAVEANGGFTASEHIQSLYQAEPAGTYPGCVDAWGIRDLIGGIEEWTLRRDGGEDSFHGNLKGRYWAESRTCQGNVRVHGDFFRFYEIGFRCCR